MIGLVWKDFRVMGKAVRSYLVVMVMYAALAFLDFLDYGFIISFLQIMLMVLPMSAFAYDDQAKWDRYAMSLPLGRSVVVGARYLFVLVLALMTGAVGAAGTVILWKFHGEPLVELILTLLVTAALGLLVSAILIPLSYKLGAERARPFLYAIVFIPIIAGVLLAKLGLISFNSLRWLDTLSPSTLVAGAALFPLGGLAALFLSYLISCRIAAGKEY